MPAWNPIGVHRTRSVMSGETRPSGCEGVARRSALGALLGGDPQHLIDAGELHARAP